MSYQRLSRHTRPSTVSTRDRIVEAARTELAKHGLFGCSIRAIAHRAGVTPGAIYKHFPDKQALVERVIELAFEKFELILLQAIVPLPPGSFDRIAAMGEAYIQFAQENQEEFKVLFEPVVGGRKKMRDLPGKGGYPILRQCIVEAIESGCIRKTNPDLVALFLWSRVLGIITLLFACDFSGEIEVKGGLEPLNLFRLTRTFVTEGLAPRV